LEEAEGTGTGFIITEVGAVVALVEDFGVDEEVEE
jgi:hypothetical protein